MKSLFKTNEDFRNFVNVPETFAFEDVRDEIISAQKKYLLPILGKEFLENVLGWVDNGNKLDDIQKKVIELCKAPVGRIAIAIAVPRLNVRAAKGGFVITTGESHQVASAWRVADYQNSYFREGQDGLSELIDFLVNDSQDVDDWYQSTAHDNLRRGIITQATDMKDFIEYEVPHFIFLRMKPIIRRIEQTKLVNVICHDLYNFLLQEMLEGGDFVDDEGDEYAGLIPLIRRAITSEAFYQGFEPLRLQFDSAGFFINYKEAIEKSGNNRPPNESERYQYLTALKQRAEEDWSALRNELESDGGNYGLWANSPCNQTNQETEILRPSSGIYPGFGV